MSQFMTPRNKNCVTRSIGILLILMLGTTLFFIFSVYSESFLFSLHSGTIYLLLASPIF